MFYSFSSNNLLESALTRPSNNVLFEDKFKKFKTKIYFINEEQRQNEIFKNLRPYLFCESIRLFALKFQF